MSKNLIQRIAVAAVAIPVILWICYEGGDKLFAMLLLFSIVGLVEYARGEGFELNKPVFWLAIVAVTIAILSEWRGLVVPPPDRHTEWWRLSFFELDQLIRFGISVAAVALFYVLSAMLFAIGKKPPSELFTRHSRFFWGVAYLGLLYPFVYRVWWQAQEMPGVSGGDLLLFLFAVLWVGDTAAMFVGKWLGRHKLAPTVSPNKTVEGFLGGIVGALIVGVAMYYWKLSSLDMANVVMLSVGCSVFGQLGDLVESMWKRSIGIKDSSALIPGHGGVLDRFDSLLFAAPFMYVYLKLIV